MYIVADSACGRLITITVALRLYNKPSIATSDVLRGHMRGESHLETLRRHFTVFEKLKKTYKSQVKDLWNVLFLQASDILSLCSGLEITPWLVDLLASVTSDGNISVCCLISGKAPPPLCSNHFNITQLHNYTVYFWISQIFTMC